MREDQAMNREAFLWRLRELLSGIPEQEAREAVQYYEDYFADAGAENEAKVIEELGSPEKVAANIRADLGYTDSERAASGGGYTDSGRTAFGGGYTGSGRTASGGGYTGSERETAAYGGAAGAQGYEGRYHEAPKEKHTALWVILAICTCYIWIPMLIGLLAVLFAILVTLLALGFSLGVVALAFLVTAVVLVGVAFVKMFVSPAGGLMLLGGGLIIAGLAIFAVIFTACLFGKWLPRFFRWLGSFGRRARRKEGGAL